jgi:hypothetical protein
VDRLTCDTYILVLDPVNHVSLRNLTRRPTIRIQESDTKKFGLFVAFMDYNPLHDAEEEQ